MNIPRISKNEDKEPKYFLCWCIMAQFYQLYWERWRSKAPQFTSSWLTSIQHTIFNVAMPKDGFTSKLAASLTFSFYLSALCLMLYFKKHWSDQILVLEAMWSVSSFLLTASDWDLASFTASYQSSQ